VLNDFSKSLIWPEKHTCRNSQTNIQSNYKIFGAAVRLRVRQLRLAYGYRARNRDIKQERWRWRLDHGGSVISDGWIN